MNRFGFAADCRPYFGSKTFRNFATEGGIYLDQRLPFDSIIKTVDAQIEKIDKNISRKASTTCSPC